MQFQPTSPSQPSTQESSCSQTITYSGPNDGGEDEVGNGSRLAESVLEEFLPAFSSLTCDSNEAGRSEQRPHISRFEKHMEIEQKSDTDREDTVIVDPHSFMKSHLPCPFYVKQKQKYRSCLTRADLREIEDLKQHLESEHHQPSYCPTCYDTFDSTKNWEDHIRRGSCVPLTKSCPEGISTLQLQELARRDDHRVSRERRWLLIWEIIFPGVKLPSPVISPGGVERMVWLLRDDWSAKGDRMVSDFLVKARLHGLHDDQISSATLGAQIFDLVIDKLVERWHAEPE
ncbi:hypothetical protein GGR55DRAFT_644453 [Xylaria sp. FL0064]|nr:hypothetical protein GGR55DRAFT_644453 [Xylaria sp. FL0064]